MRECVECGLEVEDPKKELCNHCYEVEMSILHEDSGWDNLTAFEQQEQDAMAAESDRIAQFESER